MQFFKILRFVRLFILFIYHLSGIIALLILLPLLLLPKKPLKQKNKNNFNKVIVLSSVALSYDGKIQKCLKKLTELHKEVIFIKPADAEETNPQFLEVFLKNIPTYNIGFSGSFSHFPYIFDLIIFFKLLCTHGDYIYCHDIQTCIMGIIISKIKGTILIADLHEWMSETISIHKDGTVSKLPKYKKLIFEYSEKIVLKNATHILTVNEILKEKIQEKYGIKRTIHVLKNIGSIEYKSSNIVIKKPKSNLSNGLTLIYIGQLHYHRNIENLIIGLSYVKDFQLIIQGTASEQYLEYLKQIISKYKVSNRVNFLPPVPPAEIINAIQKADIGIMSCKTFAKNLYYSLPNKVFEYLQAEVPIICEALPSVKKLFEHKKFIKYFNSDDPISFANVLNGLQNDDGFLNCNEEIKAAKKEIFSIDDYDIYKKIFK